MVLFISLNIIVGYSAFLLAAKLARGYSKVDFLISWFILFLAQVILIELILGISGKLYIEYISILSIFVCGLVFCLTRGNIGYPKFSGKEFLEIGIIVKEFEIGILAGPIEIGITHRETPAKHLERFFAFCEDAVGTGHVIKNVGVIGA